MAINGNMTMATIEATDRERLRELARSDDQTVRRQARRELARRARERNRETYEKLARE